MPCRRQTSAVFPPASCSRNTAMICSSVNLDRFIVRSFQKARTLASDGGNYGGQVRSGHRLTEKTGIATPLMWQGFKLGLGAVGSRQLSAGRHKLGNGLCSSHQEMIARPGASDVE